MADSVSNVLLLIFLLAGFLAAFLLMAYAGMNVLEAVIVGFPAAFCLLIAAAFILEVKNGR